VQEMHDFRSFISIENRSLYSGNSIQENVTLITCDVKPGILIKNVGVQMLSNFSILNVYGNYLFEKLWILCT